MSIVERLFPASELEALRGSIEGFPDDQPRKRQKIETTKPNRNNSISSIDSGYASATSDAGSPPTASSPQLQSRTPHHWSNTVSPSTSLSQSELLQKYLRSMHPIDKARYYAYQKALFRARHGGGGTHTNSTNVRGLHNANPGLGWTAGPKAAATEKVSNRLFDGIRINHHERSMLEALLPGASSMMASDVKQEEQEENAAPRIYDGIAISHAYEDEDQEEEVEYGDEEYNDDHSPASRLGEVEDFFKIEEACEEGGSDSGICLSPTNE